MVECQIKFVILCCVKLKKINKMKEQELNNMISSSILNRDGVTTFDQKDIDAIRNAGNLLDGGQATCAVESLSATLQEVCSSITVGHPDKVIKALLVRLDANDADQVHTAVVSFLSTMEDVDVAWSLANDSDIPEGNVNIYMLVAMG